MIMTLEWYVYMAVECARAYKAWVHVIRRGSNERINCSHYSSLYHRISLKLSVDIVNLHFFSCTVFVLCVDAFLQGTIEQIYKVRHSITWDLVMTGKYSPQRHQDELCVTYQYFLSRLREGMIDTGVLTHTWCVCIGFILLSFVFL